MGQLAGNDREFCGPGSDLKKVPQSLWGGSSFGASCLTLHCVFSSGKRGWYHLSSCLLSRQRTTCPFLKRFGPWRAQPATTTAV